MVDLSYIPYVVDFNYIVYCMKKNAKTFNLISKLLVELFDQASQQWEAFLLVDRWRYT